MNTWIKVELLGEPSLLVRQHVADCGYDRNTSLLCISPKGRCFHCPLSCVPWFDVAGKSLQFLLTSFHCQWNDECLAPSGFPTMVWLAQTSLTPYRTHCKVDKGGGKFRDRCAKTLYSHLSVLKGSCIINVVSGILFLFLSCSEHPRYSSLDTKFQQRGKGTKISVLNYR